MVIKLLIQFLPLIYLYWLILNIKSLLTPPLLSTSTAITNSISSEPGPKNTKAFLAIVQSFEYLQSEAKRLKLLLEKKNQS